MYAYSLNGGARCHDSECPKVPQSAAKYYRSIPARECSPNYIYTTALKQKEFLEEEIANYTLENNTVALQNQANGYQPYLSTLIKWLFPFPYIMLTPFLWSNPGWFSAFLSQNETHSEFPERTRFDVWLDINGWGPVVTSFESWPFCVFITEIWFRFFEY